MALWGWTGDVQWSFVVDTDSYAGNFERELCAYVIGECEEIVFNRLKPYIKMFDNTCDLPIDLVLSESRVVDPGDDGIHRAPMDLAPTPGTGKDAEVDEAGTLETTYDYHSVAIFLQRKPTDQELAELVKRTLEFPNLPKINEWDSRPRILGCRLVEERVQLEETQVWEAADGNGS